MEHEEVVAPPTLPWVLVLVLSVATLGLFAVVWLIVLCNWVRKVRGKSQAFRWAVSIPCLIPGFIVLMIPIAVIGEISGIDVRSVEVMVIDVFRLLCFFVPWIAVLLLSGEMRASPIGLPVGRWKTLWFGITYLQFRLNRYRAAGF